MSTGKNPGVKLFCLETPWENPGDGQLGVYGGLRVLSQSVCVWVGGWLHVWEKREGVWGGRRGERDMNVVLASKGVTRVESKRYNCL